MGSCSDMVSKGYYPANRSEINRSKMEIKRRAGERVRTVDNDVGNVVLYELSYARIGYMGLLYIAIPVWQDGG